MEHIFFQNEGAHVFARMVLYVWCNTMYFLLDFLLHPNENRFFEIMKNKEKDNKSNKIQQQLINIFFFSIWWYLEKVHATHSSLVVFHSLLIAHSRKKNYVIDFRTVRRRSNSNIFNLMFNVTLKDLKSSQ